MWLLLVSLVLTAQRCAHASLDSENGMISVDWKVRPSLLCPDAHVYPVSCIFVSFIVVSMIAIASLRVPVAHPSRFVSGDTRSGRCSLAPRYRPASAHVICRTALGEAINAASAGDASKVSSLKQRTSPPG